MTVTELTERTVSVSGRRIFVAEKGDGPAVVMLRGGGPGWTPLNGRTGWC